MSSTRKAKDDSVFHQGRYASSAEFERGLIANLVAKRCAILDDKADRELIWFVQYLSHQDGGVPAIAKKLIEKFTHRIGTPAMLKVGNPKSQNYNAAEVREIRLEIPRELRLDFPLRGETKRDLLKIAGRMVDRLQMQAENSRQLREMADDALDDCARYEKKLEGRERELEEQNAREREATKKNPSSYPTQTFRDLCLKAAEKGDESYDYFCSLEKEICNLCLNPGYDLRAGAPWYFSDLINTLREFHQRWIQEKSKEVVTTLGKKVCDALDYTLHSRSLSLLEGNPRLGKSFSARSWCVQHPGKSRFIEVPPGNDDATFFRALSRGLGLGNFLNYKVVQIRERVESVLLTGDLILVLDEAQRLWPQRNLRYGYPGRVVWVMTMANAGVPVCMVSTPQFIATQKAVEKTGWNSAQLTGRIGHYEFLPTELEDSDLINVARAVLPEVSINVLQVLADYASTSSRYLSAVDSIAKRAKYIAECNGRAHCSTEDVRTAMKESVIPSDTRLLCTLEQAKKSPAKLRATVPAPAQPEKTQTGTPTRHTGPAMQSDFSRRAGSGIELVED